MPKDKIVDFIAIDEIQMCADKEKRTYFYRKTFKRKGSRVNNVARFSGNEKILYII